MRYPSVFSVINRVRRKDTDRKRQVYLLYKNNRPDLGNREENNTV